MTVEPRRNIKPARAAGLCDENMRNIVCLRVVEDCRRGVLAGKSDGGSTEAGCKLQGFGDRFALCFVTTQFV